MSRNIQAGEIGRRLTIRNMEEDWVAAGHSALLRFIHPVTKVVFELPAVAVAGDVYACRRTTVAADFPVGGFYKGQAVTQIAGVDQWKSAPFVLPVGANVQ